MWHLLRFFFTFHDTTRTRLPHTDWTGLHDSQPESVPKLFIRTVCIFVYTFYVNRCDRWRTCCYTCVSKRTSPVSTFYTFPRRDRTRLPEKLGAHVCGCGVGGRRRKRRRARDERKNLGEKTPILNHSSHYSCTVFVCCTRYILLLFLFEGQRRGTLRVDVVIKYVRVFRRVIDRVKSPRLLFRFGVCICALLEGIHILVCVCIY